MKLTKILLTILATLALTTAIYADGSLKMKGFYHDMSFDEACKVLSGYGVPNGASSASDFAKDLSPENIKFIIDKTKTVCGYGWISKNSELMMKGTDVFLPEGYIKKNVETGGITKIRLSHDMTNHIFKAKNMNLSEFVQEFVNNYSWIEGLSVAVKHNKNYKITGKYYTGRSSKFGWEIQIGSKYGKNSKAINIIFFEVSRPSFTKNTTPNTQEKILSVARNWSQGERAEPAVASAPDVPSSCQT